MPDTSNDKRRQPIGSNRVIPSLVVCAVIAFTLTCLGWFIISSNTNHLVQIRDWLDHSHDILTNALTQSQRLDRIGYGMRLYEGTGSSGDRRAAQAAAVAMHAGVLDLETLTQDNPSQSRHAKELSAKIEELSEALNEATVPDATLDHLIQDNRRILNLIQAEERELIRQRSQSLQASREVILLSRTVFLGFSLLVIIVLFWFLLRDAIRRQYFEKKITIANDQLEATVQELERQGKQANLLKETRDELQLCVTANDAHQISARHFQELVPGSSGATMIINNSRSMLEAAATWNNPSELAETFEMDACCGLRAGRSRWRRPGQSELHCTHFVGTPPENYVCIPLAAQGDTLGFVFLSCPTKEIADLAYSRMQQIQGMVELSSMALGALNLRAKLESQSIRDGLTSLFNRHFMEIALERELHRAARRQVTLAVMMLDVDHFKVFNDTFGHEAGDEVLRAVAQCFQQFVRSEDIVCRYGGEEFVIILPEISEELALERANTIRQNVNNLRLKFAGKTLRPVTISIGLAMYPDPARGASDLLRMADRALYDAKHAGRDRIHVARETAQSELGEGLPARTETGLVLQA